LVKDCRALPVDRWPTPTELRSRVWRFDLVMGIIVLAIAFVVAPEAINDDGAVTAVRVVAAALALALIATGLRLISRYRRGGVKPGA